MYVLDSNVTYSASEQADGINGNNARIGWHNLVTPSTIASPLGSDANWPIANAARPDTWSFWRSDDTDATRVEVNLSQAETVNYFALMNHNNFVGQYEIEWQWSSSGPGGSYTTIVGRQPLTDNGITVFEHGDVSARYFRLLIWQTGLQTQPPEIGVLAAGEMLRMQRRLYAGQEPIVTNEITKRVSAISESGNYLGQVKRSEHLELQVTWDNLTPDWCDDVLSLFIDNCAALKPFFFAWRPEAYPNELGYFWLTRPPRLTNSRANGMRSLTLDMRGRRA